MPRTNTAAKKAARAAQASTGKPYMQSRRETDTSTTDWVIQLGQTVHGSLPYDFVAYEDGQTFGFIDYGVIIGFTSEPAARTLDLHWSEFDGDESKIVGKWMVTKDRFTGGWATHGGPVLYLRPAPPRAERTENYGGALPADPSMAQRLARRAMGRRKELPLAEDQYASLVVRDARGQEVGIEVEGNGLVREIVSGIAMGMLEGFLPKDGQQVVVDWETLRRDPSTVLPTLVGMRPLVWVTDIEQRLLGEIVSGEVA